LSTKAKGIPVADTEIDEDESANPNWTGIPLAVRVYQAWLRWLRSETGGYPRNHPSRPPLLRWNPYTARYEVRP
jgi:hypothetical protein